MDNKLKSLRFLASKHNCSIEELKTKYIVDLAKNLVTKSQAQELLMKINQNKYIEAEKMNMAPDETPSSFLAIWTEDYIEELDKIDISTENQIIEMLENNPDLFESAMDTLLRTENPAYYFQDKAIHKMVDEKDYEGAIPLINNGLDAKDKKLEAKLYQLRAQCKIKTHNEIEGIIDLQTAIISLLNYQPDDTEEISECYSDIFEAYMKLKDFVKAESYINQAIALSEKDNNLLYKYLFLLKRSKLYEELGDISKSTKDLALSIKFKEEYDQNPKHDDDDLPF